jgi:hypothetical protein
MSKIMFELLSIYYQFFLDLNQNINQTIKRSKQKRNLQTESGPTKRNGSTELLYSFNTIHATKDDAARYRFFESKNATATDRLRSPRLRSRASRWSSTTTSLWSVWQKKNRSKKMIL